MRRRFTLQHQVPVVAHQAVGEQIDGITLEPFGHNPLKRGKILVLPEQTQPAVAPVQNVIDQPGFDGSGSSWHGCERIRSPDDCP